MRVGGKRLPASAYSVQRKTVPPRYHRVMAMNLRLDDEEAANLRRAASKAGISMQQAARIAIHDWVARTEGMTMAELMARPPLGGGSVPPGTAARLLHEARAESGRE